MVPFALQRAVYRYYHEGQTEGYPPPSAEWHKAADDAIKFVFNSENMLANVGEYEMAKKKDMTADLTAAHLNGLRSGIHALEVQITILKQLLGGKGKVADEEDVDDEDADDEEVDEKPKKGKHKKKAQVEEADEEDEEDEDTDEDTDEDADEEDDDEDDGEEEDAADEEEEDEKPKKKKKGKKSKVTIDDVNDAAIKLAKELGDRKKVLKLLKKKFKVESVTDLEPSQYEAVVAYFEEAGE